MGALGFCAYPFALAAASLESCAWWRGLPSGRRVSRGWSGAGCGWKSYSGGGSAKGRVRGLQSA